jgi:hypothetical protein
MLYHGGRVIEIMDYYNQFIIYKVEESTDIFPELIFDLIQSSILSSSQNIHKNKSSSRLLAWKELLNY